MTEDETLSISLDAGVLLLSSGAESFRIEETVERIASSLNVNIICYVTLTSIMVSTTENTKTKICKSKIAGFDLQIVDAINELSRSLERGQITSNDFIKRIETIKNNRSSFSLPLKVLSAGLVAMAPSLIYNTSVISYVSMFFIGMIGYYVYQYTEKKSSAIYAPEFMGGLAIGIFCLIGQYLGLYNHYQFVALGAVMPLVPGLSITNAIREIIFGDIISGIVRSMKSLIIVSTLVAGLLVSIELVQFFY
ncbi:threonine/serine exporter family protein [Leuconostoc suionicum]|nr:MULTISPECIES: threonine/serine exporter family protein [Leuconostoc]MBE4728077.1 threonine/serine exporter family protein [Leuconostoc suionicum]